MNEWIRTKTELAPDNKEVLLSDGKNIYLGIYDSKTDFFFDQNNFSLKTPKYWMPLPTAPENIK